jgi:fructose-1,6-bisphosphatase/inositol monophosphatase family enzyme
VLATAKAAQLHQNYFGEIGEAQEKDPQNLLTQVDTTAEKLIIETIRAGLGEDFEEENHAIYGEETGGSSKGTSTTSGSSTHWTGRRTSPRGFPISPSTSPWRPSTTANRTSCTPA